MPLVPKQNSVLKSKKDAAAAGSKKTVSIDIEYDCYDDHDGENDQRGLLSKKRLRIQTDFSAATGAGHFHDTVAGQSPTVSSSNPNDWMRPYCLGLGLFLVLFPFWILDTLKDPIFGALTGGNLDVHLPMAKLLSVLTTLLLVCWLEYVSWARERHEQQERQQQLLLLSTSSSDSGGAHDGDEEDEQLSPPSQLLQRQIEKAKKQSGVLPQHNTTALTAADAILDASGAMWSNMSALASDERHLTKLAEAEDRVPSTIFTSIGVPYCIAFAIMAYLLQFNRAVALSTPLQKIMLEQDGTWLQGHGGSTSNSTFSWHVLGYCLYATTESFGSIMVATFWSYANSTLSLHDAERYYGLVIALAQLGAILGSTMVTTGVWNNVTLVILACLLILLHVIVMNIYSRRFPPTSDLASKEEPLESALSNMNTPTAAAATNEDDSAFWSGLYLIMKHNYVILILGASCLYEVSLTCLNYQMTLLGWKRFEKTPGGHPADMTFKQFMGHYGQMVNIFSLVLSSIIFPFLIRRLGLRWTIRLFPTLLLFANFLAFGPFPGRLWLLFVSLSTLKAMTYSIHDPSKEILYLPTSNAIKFKAKFWIDVVGARVAKAIGSSINRFAGSVDRSIRVASAPSLLTAVLLWIVCYKVGSQFESLIESGNIVGVEHDDDDDDSYLARRWTNKKYSTDSEDNDDGEDTAVVESGNKEDEDETVGKMVPLEETMLPRK